VRKAYGATVALDGVDLVVEAGQILGLLGPNGADRTLARSTSAASTSCEDLNAPSS